MTNNTQPYLSALLLDFLTNQAHNQSDICLADLLKILGTQSVGLMLFLCALICMVPMPGPNAILAIPLFIIAGQLVLNKTNFWLPNFITHRPISANLVLGFYQKIYSKLQWLEQHTQRRWPIIVPHQQWCGLGVLVLITAFAIALPLPIPGSNTVPSGGLVVLGVGLLMRDGLLIVLGGFMALVASITLFGLIMFVYGLVF